MLKAAHTRIQHNNLCLLWPFASFSGHDACSAVTEQICANAQHTEEADTSLMTGAPAGAPDLAEVLRGPVASALDGEAPADAGPASSRKGRASGREVANGQSDAAASTNQQAARKFAGQRAGKAASLNRSAEEASIPEKHDSLQPKQEKSTWGGGRRKRALDSAALPGAASASDAALPAAEQEQGPARESAAANTRHGTQAPTQTAERRLRSRSSAKQDSSQPDAEPKPAHALAAPDPAMPEVQFLRRRLPSPSRETICG